MRLEQHEICDRIRRFLNTQRAESEAGHLADDDRLLGTKALDSLGLLRLVTFVESEFSITLDDEDIVPDHFATIRHVARLVEQKINP
jgi:acyl carrier protein